MKKSDKIKLLAALAIIVGLFLSAPRKSAQYFRDRTVMIVGNEHLCSGVQVHAASGQDYILTAGHCDSLQNNNNLEVITEGGQHLLRRIIQEDPYSDLLLVEGLPNLRGLDIAEKDFRFEQIRTFTHGRGFKTYETEGVIIEDERVNVLLSVETPEDQCKLPKNKYIDAETSQMVIPVCTLSVDETMTNALIVPGSSGGMAVDKDGGLVGIVSCGSGEFGGLVRLQDIQKFLSAY